MNDKKEMQGYLQEFERRRRDNPGEPASWVEPVRTRAFARFAELGLPKPRNEEWRQTSIAPMRRTTFRAARPLEGTSRGEALKGRSFGTEAAAEIVFVNGYHAPELSREHDLPEGVLVENLSASLEGRRDLLEHHLGRYADFETRSFSALNTAFLQEGALVLVPRGSLVAKPIHLVYLSGGNEEPSVAHPRSLILVGKRAEATVIETYASLRDGTFLTNAVTEARVEEGGSLVHVKLQEESDEAFHIGAFQAHQERESRLRSFSLSFGAGLSRSETGSVLDGEGIECDMDGLYLGRGDHLVDNHTVIHHARPRCSSRELYKGILTDRSRGVFSGKIVVCRDAQKTDAKQTNQALLLSRDAAVHTKPQLEIYADDVRCTHGATVGRLDEEAVFYLRSRGLGEKAARSLLTLAFAREVVDRVEFAPLRTRLEEMLLARLPHGEDIRGVL
ncbi:MAG: Fe-S cluster assembly protein SufD [Candidatus Eisenbacteria bacterium]